MSKNQRSFRALALLFCASILGLGYSASAQAGIGIAYSPTYTLLAGNTGGFGALGGGVVVDFSSLEVGAFYQQKYFSGVTPSYLDGVVKYNFNMSPLVQVGFGGYYDILLAANGGNVTNSDYGLVAGIQTGLKVFFGVNFKYALANSNSSPSGTTNFNLLQGILGLRF